MSLNRIMNDETLFSLLSEKFPRYQYRGCQGIRKIFDECKASLDMCYSLDSYKNGATANYYVEFGNGKYTAVIWVDQDGYLLNCPNKLKEEIQACP